MALYYAEEAILVTNPEVSSVRDSDRIIGVLNSRSKRAEEGEEIKKHLLVTRYTPSRVKKGEMLSVEDIQEILVVPLMGVIPESPAVLNASNQGIPITLDNPSDAKHAYRCAVSKLLGEDEPADTSRGKFRKFLESINLVRSPA